MRSRHQGLMMRRRNPSSPTDRSQRTPAIQGGVVLWVAEPGVVVQGLGEPCRVKLPKTVSLGRRKG